MKWLNWITKVASFRGRDALKSELVKVDPTAGYRGGKFFGTETVIQDLPLFTAFIGRMMLRSDPVVSFALNARNACLSVADVEITAKRPEIQKWVEEQWETLWGKFRRPLTSAKRFGFAGLQLTFKMERGHVAIEGVKDFAPEDVRALEHGGKVVGFKVTRIESSANRKLKSPRAVWLTQGAEYGNPYGGGILRRQYPPWYIKWMDGGAQKLTLQRMMKDAWIGDQLRYPMNMLAEMPDGTKLPWRDVAREIGENRKSGGVLALPSLRNDKGEELIGYEPPQHIAGQTDLFDWTDRLDDDIFRGADVPMEVVKVGDAGGGMAGRSIPLMVVLSVCTEELIEIVQGLEPSLRALAWLNFGGEPEFEIKPKSLVESFARDAGGSALGGEAAGGGQSQARPGQNGQPPPQPKPGEVSRVTQFGEDHEFSSTQFNLPGELAFELRMLGERIPAADLVSQDDPPHDATSGRELNPHVTVKYGLHTDDAEEVRAAVQSQAPVAVQFGKCSYFKGEQHDVLKIDVQSEALHALNGHIAARLECTDTFPDYKPHVTIAYVKPGLGEHYASRLNDLEGRTAVFDRLTFSDKHRVHYPILLTGTAQFDEQTAPPEIHSRPLSAAAKRIAAAAERIRALKKNGLSLPTLAGQIERELLALHPGLSADLTASMWGGQLTGMADGIAAVPTDFPIPPAPPAAAGPPAAPPPIPPAPPAAPGEPDEPQPGVRFPVLDDALDVLEESPAAVGLDYQDTAAKVREGAFAITGDLTERAVGDVRDLLAEALRTGQSEADFADTVVARLVDEGGPLSEPHLEQVFRTNTAAALSDGQERALKAPMVADAFPYRAYFATTDTRVRKQHLELERLGLNGTNIYRADDPVWATFRPPWDFNCRCAWSPVTVEQAARRGVTEAKEWLARAEAMAAERGGSADQYLSRTEPMQPAWVTPPPFEPSPEFQR